MDLIILMQDPDLIKSLLTFKDVSTIGILLVVIVYFWWENKELKKRVEKVIDDHQKDIKDNTKDAQTMLENYHKFMDDTRKELNK